MLHTQEPIAIVGIGCRYPGADNPDAFWQLIQTGVDAITEVPPSRWDVDAVYDPDPTTPDKANTRWGGFLDQIDQFDPQFFGIAPREVSTMDPQQRLLLEVAWEALEDAGHIPETLKGSKTGVFIGIGTHDYSIMLWQQPVNDPYATTGTGNCIAANRLSYLFDFKGPSLAVDTACSSSLVAVHLACQSLWTGESSMALAGGVNILLLPTITTGFSKGGFMSAQGRCKSFDASANGYVRSEGAGIVVLKPLSHALEGGDPIYAVIRGTAVNQDGFSNGMAAPNPDAQAAVLREAYQRAGISPGQVQYVEAHGTGTKIGDPVEAQALGAVLSGDRQPGDDCAIGSVKTNIGHSETAAGVAGLIKAALALKHRQIPPSLHFQTPNPHIDFASLGLRVQTTLEPWITNGAPALAGVNSFGFGGTNAHVVLEGMSQQSVAGDQPSTFDDLPMQDGEKVGRSHEVLTLSAKNETALRELAGRYEAFLAGWEGRLADVCFTANTGRSRFHHRLACVASSVEQMGAQLRAIASGQVASGQEISGPEISGRDISGQTLVGVSHGIVTETPPSLAFLFTGQGSQYVDMGRDLYATQPVVRQTLDRCNQILRPLLGRPLLDILFSSSHSITPHSLDQTAYTQPALFAIEYALAQLWQSWGVQPSVVMGHSIGEYVAACLAGVFSLEDGLTLIAERGRLMQALPSGGGMVAVMASVEQVGEAIAPYGDEVAIAAVNSPQNIVISGTDEAIAHIMSTFETTGIKATRLNVSHAFHSSLMTPMLHDFAKAAQQVTYSAPRIPFVSTVTGRATDAIATPDYWCQHICQPVRFAAGMETLKQAGYRVFLEIGAKPILLGLGRQCWDQQFAANTRTNRAASAISQLATSPSAIWLPSLRPGASDWQTLLQSLGDLYVRGVPIDWQGVDALGDSPRQYVHLPTYPFQRQRYWWDGAIASNFVSPVSNTSTQCRHPLLGDRLRLAGTSEIRFQVTLEATSPAYLTDHRILGQPVMPGAAYVEMMMAAGGDVIGADVDILDVSIEQPLVFTAPTTVQIVLMPDENGGYAAQIFSILVEKDGNETVIRHARGTIAPSHSNPPHTPDLVQLQTALIATPIDVSHYYQTLRSQGLEYGTLFQGIRQLWCGDQEALSQIQLPDALVDSVRYISNFYHLHPVVLDACFQTLGAAIATDSTSGTYLPVGIETLRQVAPLGQSLWCHIHIRDEISTTPSSILKADVSVWNESGAIAAHLQGLTLRSISEPSLQQLLGVKSEIQWFYHLTWQSKPLDIASANCQTQTMWLLFADAQSIGADLSTALRHRGDRCVMVVPGDDFTALKQDVYAINPSCPDQFYQVLEQLAVETSNLNLSLNLNIVHLWGIDSHIENSSVSTTWEQVQQRGCGSVLYLIQAIAQSSMQSLISIRLWLITQNSQAVGVPMPLQIDHASLWGLARVIRLEYPKLYCTCIDVDRAVSTADLVNELCRSDDEDQIAYRQGDRYVARLLPHHQYLTQRVSIPKAESFRLSLSDYGVLDNLTWIPTTRRSPQPGEVEIQVRAAGINFRDVLNALGMLKDVLEDMGIAKASEVPFGGDCAGVVTAVGDGVDGLQVGDTVIAAQAVGSLGQHVTVDARFVVPKPNGLSFSEAATIPTTFLTAYYGLCHLANLKPGDRVLIHAAAGGVGQAAVLLAQSIGAEVFATASPGKWEVLRSMGVTHVMNSRTLDFAHEVLDITAGAGVDVVLNSLNGDFIPKSLSVLASQGRFVEIGKIGIWDACKIHQARPDVLYCPFDLLAVSQKAPHLVAAMLTDLIQQFQQGTLKPLTHTVFPVEDVPAAFRYMAQAKHVGKVVISLPAIAPAQPIRKDASYLITGGLGAIGLHIARWLVERGATQVVLAGRRPPSPDAVAAIRQLEQQGAHIRTAQADISKSADAAALISSFISTSDSPLPTHPLRGIIHAAGVLEDGVLQNQSWEAFRTVLAPKIAGAWNLHTLTQDDSLDFFVCFSSIAALLGSPGQGNYAAANAYMDALTHHRRSLGLPATTINWGPWAVGMAANLDERDSNRLAAQGLRAIAPDLGIQALDAALTQGFSQVGIFLVEWDAFFRHASLSPMLNALKPTVQTTPRQTRSDLRQQIETATPGDRLSLLEHHICQHLANVLGFSSPDLIDPYERFSDLGMDSLMAVELTNRLQTSLNYPIPQTLLFDHPTTNALAAHLTNAVSINDSASISTITSADPSAGSSANLSAPSGHLSINSSKSSASTLEHTSINGSDKLPASTPSIPANPDSNFTHPLFPPSTHPPIPPEYYQFTKTPEYLALRGDLNRVETLGNPFFDVHDGIARDISYIGGREVINYSTYNYLGLSGDPRVSRAAQEAIARYGTSVSASRVVSGERPIHRALEQEIAALLGTEDCIAYIGGHATNVTTIGHLFGKKDLILYDALSHNSIREGCNLSGATAIEFPHNDWRELDRLLRQHRHDYQKVLIAIEGIYSTDGDLAPLPEIVEVKRQHKAFLLVDEAHSIGVLGQRGRGIGEYFSISSSDVDLWMGTLSKSFASCGGYVAGCRELVEYLKYTAPGFVFSVGMSPANAGAALEALRILRAEPDRVAQLHQRAQFFLTLARVSGLDTGNSNHSPVIPIIVGEPYKAVRLSQVLFEHGINVQPMVYPSVPYNAARLRFFITSLHSKDQIQFTVDTLAQEIANIKHMPNPFEGDRP
ncbi:MAG: aminotransferase class I/II-fold pyridoxal phosphate-dependent enzyme [Elainellaceae cyanobacterium]